MTVLSKVRKQLANSEATEVEQEIAKALAKQLDRGDGGAAVAKELQSMLKAIEDRQPAVDLVDDLTKAREKRLQQRNAAGG